jgi:hypothetical protein
MTNKYEPQTPSIVEQLRRTGETFELLTIQDTAANTQWLKSNFPIASAGRINWEKVPESVCIEYFDDSELLLAFERIVAQQQLEDNLNLTVSWGNALTLPIQINMEVLRKYAESIFAEDWETWICNEQDGWLIENYHDGEICFGKCIKQSS